MAFGSMNSGEDAPMSDINVTPLVDVMLVFFHIPEDFLLASSAVPGLYLFFKEYTASHLHTSTLFRARMINLALIIACGAIGVLFMISMVCELAQEQALSK